MAKIGIVGSGSWGIALAVLLYNNGHSVSVWSALPEEITEMKTTGRHHTLPDLVLPDGMMFTESLEEVMEDKEVLVTAVPSVYVRSTAQKMKPYCREGQIIVNVAKGIEESTLKTLSEILEDELPMADVAVLSGPSHAEEVSRGLPTTCVAGAHSRKTAEYIQSVFMSEVFRVYTSPDMQGIELGGSLKNVIALAAGIADGLGYGDNTKAALITRGIAEIARLGTAMGGKFQTFCGLSGIGDLIVTCAMKEVKMVVEGVYSAKAALQLSEKYGIDMPIVEQVNAILFDHKPASEAVKGLMLRDKTIESSDLPW